MKVIFCDRKWMFDGKSTFGSNDKVIKTCPKKVNKEK